MSATITVGLDLAKTTFYAMGVAPRNKEVWRKKLTRAQVVKTFAKLEPCVIAMEACSGAHYWAREFKKLGHRVELYPPQHVKPYQRGQKNDYNDARALVEVSQHGSVRTVRIKQVEEQDQQSVFRIRKNLVKTQTSMINQMRGLLAEYGLVISKNKVQFCKALPMILEDGSNGLSALFRAHLHRQYELFKTILAELNELDEQLKLSAKADERVQRLQEVRGFGVINGAAFASAIGDGTQFATGRDAAAALGLVPRQHTTGGKIVLMGITKRGDSELRTLIVHGARAVVQRALTRDDPLSLWIRSVVARRGFNKAVVAYANKMVRIGWAILRRGERYQPNYHRYSGMVAEGVSV